MEGYRSLFSFFSSFLTVAAVAGITCAMADGLGGIGNAGKRGGISGKLRYLCALGVVASLAAPLPKFLSGLQETLADPSQLVHRFEGEKGEGEALGGALFSSSAAEALKRNAESDLRARLSLTEEDLRLFFTVAEAEAETKEEEKEEKETEKEEDGAGDRLFAVESIRAELYTLRAVAKSEEIEQYLSVFDCPVRLEEHLLDRSSGG